MDKRPDPGQSVSQFPSAERDAAAAEPRVTTPQTASPTYRLGFMDPEFLLRDEARPIRLQLELLKPELLLEDYGIRSTIVVYGSARIPEPGTARQRRDAALAAQLEAPDDIGLKRRLDLAERRLALSRYYEEARRFSEMVSAFGQTGPDKHCVVTTGGGPGIMEAANRGAADAGALSVGLNIVLPHEQVPNSFITPELCFQFHYFALRKMHFLLRARALVVFPGGYGTLDELFETLTLIQTERIDRIPVILFGEAYWRRIVDFEALVDEGMITSEDVEIMTYVETAEEALAIIRARYDL